MLTNLFSKSSYLASIISYIYLIGVLIFKIRENHNYQIDEFSLIEYLVFIVLFIILLEAYNRWISHSAKNDGINTSERSINHLILFPIIVSFMPSEIIKIEWILGVYFLFIAYKKYSLLLDNTKDKDLIKTGIFMSFSIMFIPYFIVYLILMLVRSAATGKFIISKSIALILPSLITYFLVLTINTFSTIKLPFYKFINSQKDFFSQITDNFQGVCLIILSLIALLMILFVKKKKLYKLERNTHAGRIVVFIVHLLLISFIKSPETLIILTASILYGLELLIRVTEKKILKESFLVTILFFSFWNTYLSF